MKTRITSKILLATGLIVIPVLQSCDSDYDLSKDINTEINVGNNLYFPIGETDTLKVSRIIKPNDEIRIDKNGNYCIIESGDLNINNPFVETIFIKDISIEPTYVSIPVGKKGDFTVKDYVVDNNVEYIMPFNSDVDIPKEIKELHQVDITPVNAILKVSIAFDNENTITKLHDIQISNLNIQFPESIVFAENIPNFDYQTNTLTVNEEIKGVVCTEFDMQVIGIKNLTKIENQQIKIQEKLKCKGHVSAQAVNITGDELSSMKLVTSFTVPDIQVLRVYGKLNTDITIDAQDITFDNIPDLLRDSTTKLELNRIYGDISIENATGIPFTANLKFKAFNAEGNPINHHEEISLDIAKAVDFQTPSTSKFIISNKDDILIPDGYKKILNPEFNQLIELIPATVSIEPKVSIDQNQNHFYELGKEQNSSAKYNVYLPFDLGKNSQITYIESFRDIQKDLSDVTDLIQELQLELDIQNLIPLDLVVNVTPYDITGQSLADRIDISKDIKISGYKSTVKEEKTTIEIKEKEKGALSEIDKLEVKIVGKCSMDNITLSPSQYILLSLKGKLPKGINIK